MKVFLAIIIVLFGLSPFCSASSKVKSLPQILDEYAKKGYTITGPVEVTELGSDYIKLYRSGLIRGIKELKVRDKKGKPAILHKGDQVYVIRKGNRVIIIKLPLRKMENE